MAWNTANPANVLTHRHYSDQISRSAREAARPKTEIAHYHLEQISVKKSLKILHPFYLDEPLFETEHWFLYKKVVFDAQNLFLWKIVAEDPRCLRHTHTVEIRKSRSGLRGHSTKK